MQQVGVQASWKSRLVGIVQDSTGSFVTDKGLGIKAYKSSCYPFLCLLPCHLNPTP